DCAACRAESVLDRAAFFRLISSLDLGFIALKPGVFVQEGLAWVRNLFTVSHLLIMRLSGIGRAQIGHALGLSIDDDYVLVAMGLFLATVLKRLFFRLLRPLPSSLRAIHTMMSRPLLLTLVSVTPGPP